MKLSVSRKVANGVVICLVTPAVAALETGSFDSDGNELDDFSAKDNFDLVEQGDKALTDRDQVVVKPPEGPGFDPCDPSAGEPPEGYELNCVEATKERPQICYRNATELVTTEEGQSDLIEIYAASSSLSSLVFGVRSTDLSEVRPFVDSVDLSQRCRSQLVWVTGQDDGNPDGDRNYEIQFWDDNNRLFAAIPGINFDDDQYSEATVHVEGPKDVTLGETGQYEVIVQNVSVSALPASNLLVQSTPGIEITSFATSVVGGGPLDGTVSFKNGVLTIDDFTLQTNEILLVTLQALINSSGPQGERVFARVSRSGGPVLESDDEKVTESDLPR